MFVWNVYMGFTRHDFRLAKAFLDLLIMIYLSNQLYVFYFLSLTFPWS